jgi:hypothetical protein
MAVVDTVRADRAVARLADALSETGLAVEPLPVVPPAGADAVVSMRSGSRSWRFALVSRARAPYPNELGSLPGLPPSWRRVLVCDFVPETLASRLADCGWSWADDAGNHVVAAPGLHLRQRAAVKSRPRPHRRRIPQGEAGLRVIRYLTTIDGEMRTAAVAAELGLPRPRVAQIFGRLQESGLVEPRRRGVWSVDRAALVDAFVADYRGPGGTVTWWYSLDEPLPTAQAIAAAAPHAAFSADVAVDLLTPWRRPTHLIVYHPSRLTPAGLTAAGGPADGNVEIRVPADGTVFPSAPIVAGGLALADVLQVLWDVRALGGDDRLEGAGRFRAWLLSSRDAT